MYNKLTKFFMAFLMIATSAFAAASPEQQKMDELVRLYSKKKITDFSAEELTSGLTQLKRNLEVLEDNISSAQREADGSFIVKVDESIRSGTTASVLVLVGTIGTNIVRRVPHGNTSSTIIGLVGSLALWGILSGVTYGAVKLSQIDLNEMKALVPVLKFQIDRLQGKIQRNASAN